MKKLGKVLTVSRNVVALFLSVATVRFWFS